MLQQNGHYKTLQPIVSLLNSSLCIAITDVVVLQQVLWWTTYGGG